MWVLPNSDGVGRFGRLAVSEFHFQTDGAMSLNAERERERGRERDFKLRGTGLNFSQLFA